MVEATYPLLISGPHIPFSLLPDIFMNYTAEMLYSN